MRPPTDPVAVDARPPDQRRPTRRGRSHRGRTAPAVPAVLALVLLVTVAGIATATPATATVGAGTGGDGRSPQATGEPVAACEISRDRAEPGEPVVVNASGTTGADLVQFDLNGDRQFDVERETNLTVTRRYEAGTYRPRVEASAPNGADEAECGTLVVAENRPPTAVIAHEPASPTAGEPVTFDAGRSTDVDGSIAGTVWRIDGERVAATQRFTWTFEAAGDHRVSLTVVDDDGLEAVDRATLAVAPPNEPPTAAFAVRPTSPVVGDAVRLDASGSADPDGAIATYRWDVGDDGSAELVTDGPVATYTFDAAGPHPVRLSVVDDRGDASEARTVVDVRANAAPVAALAVSPDAPVAGEPVRLDASGSADPDGTVVRWAFDLDGDGRPEVVADTGRATHRFDEPGKYRVAVAVTDDRGATDTAAATVVVGTGATGGTSAASPVRWPAALGPWAEIPLGRLPWPIALGAAAVLLLGVTVAWRRRSTIAAGLARVRDRLRRRMTRRKLLRRAVGRVVRWVLRKLADGIEVGGRTVGDAIDRAGRAVGGAVRRSSKRAADALRALGR